MGFNLEKIQSNGGDGGKPESLSEKYFDWDPFKVALIDISFSSFEEPREIVNSKIFKLQERVLKYLSVLDINPSDYNSAFSLIIKQADTNEAVKKLCSLMEDITNIFRGRLPEVEKIEREEWKSEFHIKAVNQLIGYTDPYYSMPEILNIHILPNRTTSMREKIILFREGFRDLAQIVNANEKIKKIIGDSWIVLEKPELVKDMGFKVDKNFKEEFRRIVIEKNKKTAETVSMNREDFLKKYLQ